MSRTQEQDPPGPLLRTGAAAKIAGVNPRTLLRWAAAGLVSPEQVTPGGQRKWRESAIVRLLRPVPAEVTG